MKTHDLIQGTPAWHAHRTQFFNASDAPAMMGCSPYETRTQLIQRLKTGLAAEVDAATQRRFDDGHRFEALARPLAEEIIGEDLYAVTGTEGKLSASFDGLTIAEDTAFEHKTLNDSLCYDWDQGNGYHLPMHYQVQMEQQTMVSGAERVLFMATRWNGNTCVESKHCWYASSPDLRARIAAGWAQLEADLAAYQAPEAVEVVTGRSIEALPALRIEVTGAVTASNLAPFKEHALAVFESINRDLKTDQDFADAEKAVKWCGDVEDRLAAAKQHALSQTESIDALFRTIDDIGAEARRVRLDLDKLVKARKEAIRGEIVAEGVNGLRDHLNALNESLGRPWMPAQPVDFGGAIKGKKNLDSMRDAVSTALANAKIEASATADKIRANLVALEARPQYAPLFPDARQLVLKAADDLAAVIAQRVTEFEAAEAKRKTAEETARAAVAQAAAPAPAPVAAPTPAAKAEAPASTLKLGQINERLAPLSLSVDALRALGFEPVGKERAAVLYAADDFLAICAAIVDHVETITEAA